MKISSIITKNLKILIRSRISALIIIIGPLLIALLVGVSFNTSTLHNIGVGVYSESYNEYSESIVTALADKQFSVTKEKSEVSCKRDVISGDQDVCIIIDPNLSPGVANNNKITFHVDNSRINIVHLIIEEISSKIQVKTTELSKEYTQTIISSLDNTKTKLEESKPKIDSIASENKLIQSKSDSISNSISAISITFDNETISKLKEETNTSSDTIKGLVSDLDTQIRGLISKTETITGQKDSIVSDSNYIKSKASENTQNIQQVKSNIDNVVSNINSIKVREAENIVTPIRTVIEPISTKKTHWTFLFPTLVALIIMFVSVILSSSLVLSERRTKAYFRNFITPTNDLIFLFGTYLTSLFILIIQLLIIFGQAFYFLKQELLNVLASSSLVLFTMASVFIFIGMSIGYFFRSEETSVLAAISISSFFLFFSNAILPIETIPAKLSWIATFNPFVISNDLLKKLILFQSSITDVLSQLYMLLSYLMLALIIAFTARELTKRRYQ